MNNIYIPIWLDLLLSRGNGKRYIEKNLHSNMVRFIIVKAYRYNQFQKAFTFQYG